MIAGSPCTGTSLAGRVFAQLQVWVMAVLLAAATLAGSHAALAQSATVVVNPSTFTAAGEQITFTYTVNPGSYSITSVSAVSQIKLIPITCQTPNDTNPFTCTGVYTVSAEDNTSGFFTDIVAFSGTRVGGPGTYSFMGPNVTVLKSGGGAVLLDVSTSPNPSTPGATVTATVSLSSQGCNAGVMPPGPVSVTIGPETRNVTPVPPFPGASGGSVTFTTSTLPTGSHAVTASFAATSGCAAGSFSGLTHTVEPQPTVTIGTAVQTGDSLAFPVTFSVPVTGFTASDVTVVSTAGATSTVISGSGASYTATITGMTLAGNVSVSVAANRASSAAGSRNLASNTSTFAYVPMTLDAVSVPAPIYNQAYSFGPFTVTNGTAPYTFNVSAGALPSGITLSTGGSLSGTTRQAGNHSFTVRAVDANGRVATRAFSFTVAGPTITISPNTLPSATVDQPYSQALSVAGGATPYSYAVTAGALPAGVVLNTTNGTISGTPLAAGTFNFAITATDAGGYTGTRAFSLDVGATVPTAPQNVSVALSGTTATVSFSPPASDGGSAVQNYTVTFNFNTSSVTFTSVASSPFTLTGLSYGTEYTMIVAAQNAIGVGPGSAPIVFTPQAAQTITFANPGTQNFGTTPTLTATASSGLPVSFASQTTGVCTITSGGQLTFLTAGTCTIQADQAGNAATAPAPTVTRSFTVNAIVPTAPLNPVATAGDTQALVSFSAPASNGGSLITSYTVTSSPDGIVANGASSPIAVSGLTNGVSYTFTVRAENAAGPGPESAASNAVTPKASQTISFANPGAQEVGTPATLTATALSGLPVSFSSSTSAICTITSAGALTPLAPGLCTINADQAGDQSWLAAPTVSQTFTVILLAPTVTNGAATVAANSAANVLTPTLGGGPTATLQVTTPPAHGTVVVNGLTFEYTPTAGYSGGDSFNFAAQNATATSAPATFSITVTQPTLEITPKTLPDGRVGTVYTQTLTADLGTGPYGFATTGGTLPAGMTLGTDGTLSGTPTVNGVFAFTVTVTDSLGATGLLTLSLTVAEELPIAANSALTVAANAPATPVPLTLSGGIATSLTITAQPAHGTLSVSGATVSYTPTPGYSGSDGFSYVAGNSGGNSQEAVVSITVTQPTLSVTPPTLPDGRVGTAYVAAFAADLGTAPYSFAVTQGALPPGLTLAPDGALTGTPTADGSFSFAVTATDALGATGTSALTLAIALEIPVAADSALIVAANAAATPVPLDLSGGTATGLSVTTGPLHGSVAVSGATMTYTPNPGYSGADSLTYTASNGGGTSAPATVSITVTPPVLTVAPSTLPDGEVGQAYAASFTADLGTAPYSFALTAGSLPGGLTLATDGALSGTPTAAGSFDLTITATDSLGATGTVSLTLVIDAAQSGIVAQSQDISIPGGGVIVVNIAEGATGDVTGGRVLGVTPPEAGTAEIISPPGDAQVSRAEGTPVYMRISSASGFVGSAEIGFVLTGPGGESAPALVRMTVLAAENPLETGDAYELGSAQADAAMRMARGQMDGVNSHMRELRQGDCLANSFSLSLKGPSSAGGDSTTATLDKSGCSTLADGAVGVWATGALEFGTWDDSTFAEEFDHATRRLTVGLDYQLSDRAIAGLSLGYTRDVTEIGTSGSESTNKALSAAVYLTYGLDSDFFVDSMVGVSKLGFDSRRWVASESVMALGERDGRQVFFSVALGKDFSTETHDLEAFLRLSGSRSVLDDFTETGAVSALTFEEQTVKSLVGSIGFAAGTDVSLPSGMLRPSFRGELSHEFADAGTIGVSYGAGGGVLFERDAARRSRTELSLGVGFDFLHQNGWTLDGELGLRFDGDGLVSKDVKLNWALQF